MDYHYEYSIYNSHHKLVVNRQSAKTNILKKVCYNSAHNYTKFA